MAKEPYVYGWSLDGRHRAIMLTRSRAAVVRALRAHGVWNTSDGYLRDYGGETGNPVEIEAATRAGEGVILIAPISVPVRSVDDYEPLA